MKAIARMVRLERYPYIVLFLILAALTSVLILYIGREVSITNHKFCAVITTVTSRPAHRPRDANQHISEEQQYQLYLQFVQLKRDLGC